MATDIYKINLEAEGLSPTAISLTPTQERFVAWIAADKHISITSARRRYADSLAAVAEGHGGSNFRRLCQLNYKLFLPFFSDEQPELPAAYQFYGPLHFLRMLSYREPDVSKVEGLAELALASPQVTILDFGCGLAQLSRATAKLLARHGIEVRLVLADLPSLRTRFLRWDAADQDYETVFMTCDGGVPSTVVPRCALVIASEVLEHVYNPGAFLDYFHRCLAPGGILSTNIHDHQEEFMHVSPRLDAVRSQLAAFEYEAIAANVLYRKPARPLRRGISSGKGQSANRARRPNRHSGP